MRQDGASLAVKRILQLKSVVGRVSVKPAEKRLKKKTEDRIYKQARELAATGRHISWFYVAWEIREKAEPLAMQLLKQEPVRSEIDSVCEKATRTKWATKARNRQG